MRSRLSGRLLAHAAACALAAGLAGCAHSESAADRRITELREDIGEVQAEQDRTHRRLGGLEEAAAGGAASSSPASSSPASPPASPPRTVRIGDPDRTDADDPNDPKERPAIRLHGQGGGRPLRGKSGQARVTPADEGGSHDDTSQPSPGGAGPKESR